MINVLLPIFFGIVILYYFQGNVRSAEDIGLGEETSAYYPMAQGYPIHIAKLQQVDSVKQGWENRGEKLLYLWQGNSQLHGVNQLKPGQVNCVSFLFDSLKSRNEEVIGASYPNGNMQEFLVSLIYFANRFPLKAVIQPLFYDDMREDGIRDDINTFQVVKSIKADSVFFKDIPNINVLKPIVSTSGDSKTNDFKALDETAQDAAERYLDDKLNRHWSVWRKRPDVRGSLFDDIYKLRNMVLGIKATTVRKMIPGRYTDNYNSILDMLSICEKRGIPLIIYIPPIRNDVHPPYDLGQYAQFKEQVKADCEKHHALFLNLEALVPAKYWGTKEGTSFGVSEEIDFMHFREAGHRLIADTIFQTLTKIFPQ